MRPVAQSICIVVVEFHVLIRRHLTIVKEIIFMPVYHPVSAAEHNTFGIKPIPGISCLIPAGRQCPILICMIPLICLFLINPASHHRAALGEIITVCADFPESPLHIAAFSQIIPVTIRFQPGRFQKAAIRQAVLPVLAVSDPLALIQIHFFIFKTSRATFCRRCLCLCYIIGIIFGAEPVNLIFFLALRRGVRKRIVTCRQRCPTNKQGY